jgi:hypothetical protein
LLPASCDPEAPRILPQDCDNEAVVHNKEKSVRNHNPDSITRESGARSMVVLADRSVISVGSDGIPAKYFLIHP